jgi:hypothetical protein
MRPNKVKIMVEKNGIPEYEAHIPADTSVISVRRGEDGQYTAHWDGHRALVRVRRCFPWADQDKHITLRDDEDREVAHIRELGDLDGDSRQAVMQALSETAFVLELTRIDEVREEFEIRNWSVQTRQGPRSFQTRRDDWPRTVDDGGILVRDVAGDLFHIASLDAFDPASRKRIAPLID